MTLSKNDYLKKGDTYLRVIEVLGEIMFLSWPFQEYDDCMGNGVLRREVVDSLCTIHQLKTDGWTKCTPQEAGAPEEKWKPKEGEEYLVVLISPTGEVDTYTYTWANDEADNKCFAIGNVHKTEGEAIEWAKKRYNIV